MVLPFPMLVNWEEESLLISLTLFHFSMNLVQLLPESNISEELDYRNRNHSLRLGRSRSRLWLIILIQEIESILKTAKKGNVIFSFGTQVISSLFFLIPLFIIRFLLKTSNLAISRISLRHSRFDLLLSSSSSNNHSISPILISYGNWTVELH